MPIEYYYRECVFGVVWQPDPQAASVGIGVGFVDGDAVVAFKSNTATGTDIASS